MIYGLFHRLWKTLKKSSLLIIIFEKKYVIIFFSQKLFGFYLIYDYFCQYFSLGWRIHFTEQNHGYNRYKIIF